MEGNLRFKIDWANSYCWKEIFRFVLCFSLYLRAIFKYKPPGGLYLKGDLKGGFAGGLIHGGAYFGILRYFNFCHFRALGTNHIFCSSQTNWGK